MASPVAAGVLFLGRRIPLKHFRSFSVPPSKTKVVDIILESKPNYEDVKLRPPKPNTAKISELSSMQQQQAHQIAIIIITTTKIKKKRSTTTTNNNKHTMAQRINSDLFLHNSFVPKIMRD